MLLAAGANGIAAIDAVHLEILDAAGLREEAEDAAALGFMATACIHPSQVPIVRDAYGPIPNASPGRAPCWPKTRGAGTGCSRSTGRWSTRRCSARPRRSCAAAGG